MGEEEVAPILGVENESISFEEIILWLQIHTMSVEK
jgi:hypothetical protein